MKIELINCPVQPSFLKRKPTVPFGLLSIAAFLQEKGINAPVRNLAFESWDNIESLLMSEQPDLVGLSFYTINRVQSYRLAGLVRKVLPGATIVMGGHHASYLYEQLLDRGYADIVVIGEGEQTFYEMVSGLAAGQSLDQVPGLAFKRGEQTVVTPKRGFIKDLDSLPWFGEAHASLGTYHHHLPRKLAVDIAQGAFGPRPWEFTHFRFITSRGCPYKCQFCSVTVLGGGQRFYWRGESAARVADKVQFLYEQYNCRFLTFMDSSFNIEPDRVVGICQEFINRGLIIRWKAIMRANPKLTPTSMLSLMKQAGCWMIHYGAESGAPEILKTINKGLRLEDIQETVVRTEQIGIKVRLLLMVGNPGESEETIRQTVELVNHCRPTEVGVQPTVIYPGTALYSLAQARGWIDDDFWLTDSPTPLFPSASYIQSRKWLAQLRSINYRFRALYVAASSMKTGLSQLTLRQPPLFDRVR